MYRRRDEDLTDEEIDVLLNMLWNDYAEEANKEEPFEKYYKQGWNDAIKHIQEFLDNMK